MFASERYVAPNGATNFRERPRYKHFAPLERSGCVNYIGTLSRLGWPGGSGSRRVATAETSNKNEFSKNTATGTVALQSAA